MLEGITGIYATAPTCSLSILARDRDFRFPQLNGLIVQERGAVRMRAMRYSNFLIPVSRLPSIYQATKKGRANPIKQLLNSGVTDAQYEDIARLIERLLGDGSRMTAGEIKKALPVDASQFGGAFSFVLPQMCEEGRLVRAGVRGGWKSDLYEYARFDRWLPGVDLEEISPEEGRAELARLYFGTFGPASEADFRWWSGLSKEEAGHAISAIRDQLVTVQVDQTELWLPASRQDELRRSSAKPSQGVRLLPVWDAYLMAYRDHSRYLTEAWYHYVYAGTGDATSTVLLDGSPGGVWEFREEKKTLVVRAALFEESRQGLWDELREQVLRLADVTGYSSAALLRCEPVSLKGSPQNRFRSPLKDTSGETVFVM